MRLVAPSRALPLSRADAEVARVLAAERRRRAWTLSLVPGEAVIGRAVRQAAGSVVLGRYAAGLPGARHAPGAGWADALEDLARRRACSLFGAEHANVQPHAHAQANLAVYHALCRPGDTILAMDPALGGHLTHGAEVNASGRFYRFVHYGVRRETERVDLDEVADLARRVRPALIVAGGASYPRAVDYAGFAEVARAYGARLLADAGQVAGLQAAGVLPSPVPHADAVTVATHEALCGPRGGLILCRAVHARAVDRAVCPGTQEEPLPAALAAKAVCLGEAAAPAFAAHQAAVAENAAALARALEAEGLRPVTGGTDTHLVVVDLRAHGLTGRQAERALEAAGILVQKAMIPYDPQPPMRGSGIRAGSAGLTARGMGAAEMREVAALIGAVLRAAAGGTEQAAAVAVEVRSVVRGLAGRFPWPAA